MTVEEFLEFLEGDKQTWRKKALADRIIKNGWYPEQIIRINPLENTLIIEKWCREKLSSKWENYNGYYWMFESEKEAIYFKTVW